MPLLYHAYVYLEFLILACTIYILASYGVREAADGYFGKTFSELSEYECAMLAGIPNAPSVYSPNAVNESTARRVECVLESIVKNRIISQEQAYNIEMEQ